jgi:hypothetical protein
VGNIYFVAALSASLRKISWARRHLFESDVEDAGYEYVATTMSWVVARWLLARL